MTDSHNNGKRISQREISEALVAVNLECIRRFVDGGNSTATELQNRQSALGNPVSTETENTVHAGKSIRVGDGAVAERFAWVRIATRQNGGQGGRVIGKRGKAHRLDAIGAAVTFFEFAA